MTYTGKLKKGVVWNQATGEARWLIVDVPVDVSKLEIVGLLCKEQLDWHVCTVTWLDEFVPKVRLMVLSRPVAKMTFEELKSGVPDKRK